MSYIITIKFIKSSPNLFGIVGIGPTPKLNLLNFALPLNYIPLITPIGKC